MQERHGAVHIREKTMKNENLRQQISLDLTVKLRLMVEMKTETSLRTEVYIVRF